MADVYVECPRFEDEKWLLRFVTKEDSEDLLKVYGDKNALPFFNSDNCDGDNFYYPTKERMDSAIDFWLYSYDEKWFVRWAIVDKSVSKAVGTIEMFQRRSDDGFGTVGVIRLDLQSSYEKVQPISELLKLIIPAGYEMFDVDRIISKVPNYAVDREEAFAGFGFERTDTCLVDKEGFAYRGYMIVSKAS